tara:strand:+ start:8966 stop:9496 length:531 start_codon:yes stop_codon:yes gene_type:complete
MNTDQLKLDNGQVVTAVFRGLESEGEGNYGKWFKYGLSVSGQDMIFFANEKQQSVFSGLSEGQTFSFGKIKKTGQMGTYHKVERVESNGTTSTDTSPSPAQTTTNTNNESRTFTTREASIVAGVAVKVAGWSISPSTFSEDELYKRSKAVLSVLGKLETDLLHKQVDEIFGATDDE